MIKKATKLNLHVLRFILFIFSIGAFVSCSSSSTDDPITNSEPDPESSLDLVYIDNQADFDFYRKKEFPAGARIYFAAGKIFNGQFAPTGSGTNTNPIKLSAYNSSTKEVYLEAIDNKPIINGQGSVNSALYIYNGENWEINNLELTNTNGTNTDQGDLRGIHLVAEDIGTVENVTIKNCYVHDVNGMVEGKERGGIHVHVIGNKVKTKYNNLLIENNIVKTVGGVGIGNQSTWKGVAENSTYHPWTNFVVRGNRVENTGRNGIIFRMSRDGIAEYNVLANNSRASTGHSIFNFNTENCVIQYNEAYGNTGDEGDKDRGGFDADYNAHNTTYQYNYSHDNHWFIGIMRKYNKGIVIRYNISVNDRLGAYEYGFPTNTGVEDVYIYNNTHYFGAGITASPFASPSKTRKPIESTVMNNIYYFAEPGSWEVLPDLTSCVLSNNLFYNLNADGIDNNPIHADPLFENAGVSYTDIDMTSLERLAGYKLKDNSPCVNAGLVIVDNGGVDFWGNPLPLGSPSVGAYEKQ